MTLDKAKELLRVHDSLGGAYNRNGAKLILQKEYGQAEKYGFKPGESLFG